MPISIFHFKLIFHMAKLSIPIAVLFAYSNDVLAQSQSASSSYDCEATWIGGEAEYCASIGNISGLERIADLRGISNGLRIYTRKDVERLEAGISAADILASANEMEGHLRVAYAYANGDERWSRKFRPVFKVDHMTKEVIQDEETKEPFARVQSQGCA